MTEEQQPTNTAPKSRDGLKAAAKVVVIVAAIIVLAKVLSGTVFRSINASPKARELEWNQAKWESQHITHYRMSLDIWGFSESVDRRDWMPLVVEVKNDEVVSVVNAHGTSWPTDYPDISKAFTIPGLFSIANDWIGRKPASINVTYHPTLGIPTDITIDPWEEPCCQWRGYRIEGFEELLP
jgi:uncharacterized protein DUF6174